MAAYFATEITTESDTGTCTCSAPNPDCPCCSVDFNPSCPICGLENTSGVVCQSCRDEERREYALSVQAEGREE